VIGRANWAQRRRRAGTAGGRSGVEREADTEIFMLVGGNCAIDSSPTPLGCALNPRARGGFGMTAYFLLGEEDTQRQRVIGKSRCVGERTDARFVSSYNQISNPALSR